MNIAHRGKSVYHIAMTIKRRLFFSNIRMIVITLAALVLIGRVMIFLLYGENVSTTRHIDTDTQWLSTVLFFAIFAIVASMLSNYYTHRMTKVIVKPLDPLGEGVRQIEAGNLAYRIGYQGDDEFRPICDAFDKMAEKLETLNVQQKKDEANRRELFAGISHDLRNPLASILGSVEGLDAGIASTPQMQRRYVGFIKNETEHMKRIIEQLFLFSKLDMDEFPINLHTLDISAAIGDMISHSITAYERRGLSIELGEMPKNVAVCMDAGLLRNVVVNILENSAKHKHKERGRVEISGSLSDGHVFLRFADDGPGVDETEITKIMDVFYRADPSRSKKGSGLGLAISAKIIRSMGGQIYAQMPGIRSIPGVDFCGLTIVIKLPVAQEMAEYKRAAS